MTQGIIRHLSQVPPLMPRHLHYRQSVFPAISLPLASDSFPLKVNRVLAPISPALPFSSPPGLCSQSSGPSTGGQWGRSGVPIPQMCWQRLGKHNLPRMLVSQLAGLISEAWTECRMRHDAQHGKLQKETPLPRGRIELDVLDPALHSPAPRPSMQTLPPPHLLLIRSQVKLMQRSWVPTSPGRCRTGWGWGMEWIWHPWVQPLSVQGQTLPLIATSFNLPLGAPLLWRALSVSEAQPSCFPMPRGHWCLLLWALPLPALKSGFPCIVCVCVCGGVLRG